MSSSQGPPPTDPITEHDRVLAFLANAFLSPEFVVHYAAGFIAQAQEAGGVPPVRLPGTPEVPEADTAPGADRPWFIPV